MVQLARPSSLITRGSWTRQDAATAGTALVAALSDDLDTTYVVSDSTVEQDIYVVKLGSVTDPIVNTGHSHKYRYAKSASGGAAIDLVTEFREGYVNEGTLGTLINSHTLSDISGTTVVQGSLALTNASAISNYGNLFVRHVKNIATVVGEILASSIATISDPADASSYTSNTATPLGNRLLVAFIGSTKGSTQDPDVPTVTGWGRTWTVIASQHWGATTDTTRRKIHIAVAKTASTSPGSGQLAVDFGGNTQTSCEATVISVGGADLSGSASAAIVQSPTNGPTVGGNSGSLTFAAAGNSNNRMFGAVAQNNNVPSPATFSGSWVSVVEVAHNSPSLTFSAAWRPDATSTSMAFSLAQTNKYGAAGVEVKAA